MWKLQMAEIREESYDSLISHWILNLDQRKRELLCIHQLILMESKTRRKNRYYVNWRQKCIKYGPKKLDNRLSQSAQVKSYSLSKIPWKTGEWNWQQKEKKNLTEVKVLRGVFQGDNLSPLQLLIAMMTLSHILGNAPADINTINRHPSWVGLKTHRLHLYWGVNLPEQVSCIWLNNLMVRLH